MSGDTISAAGARFLTKVNKSGPTPSHQPELGACWIWTGAKSRSGYGSFGFGSPTTLKAHRFSWLYHCGSIPPRVSVLHRCDTPSCVNPEHLFLGTQTDNMRDAAAKGRLPKGEQHREGALTHCRNGHPFDAQNTYRYDGTRYCRKCKAESQARYRLRLKQGNAK